MKSLQRIPSCLILTGAAAVATLPVLHGSQDWCTRICEPDTFLLAFTLACTAVLLWPQRTAAPERVLCGGRAFRQAEADIDWRLAARQETRPPTRR